jgi:hypothetical protein
VNEAHRYPITATEGQYETVCVALDIGKIWTLTRVPSGFTRLDELPLDLLLVKIGNGLLPL